MTPSVGLVIGARTLPCLIFLRVVAAGVSSGVLKGNGRPLVIILRVVTSTTSARV